VITTDILLEKDLLPDSLIRQGIRRLLRQRLRDENKGDPERQQAHFLELIGRLKRSPVAIQMLAANEQHYEVPTGFYQKVLGKHMKYSCGLWEELSSSSPAATGGGSMDPRLRHSGMTPLDRSEEAMLGVTCARAELADGQDVLELGCGWGSLSLFMAARYPRSRVIAVSNSRTQKAFIDEQAVLRGLQNLSVVTSDMNEFQNKQLFDRVVSVEMFEHMRNYERLMARIAGWLKPDGKLFVHIFTHREYAYLFEVQDESDWMSRYFFTGGIMPSDHLLLYFQKNLKIEQHWRVSGQHYQKTSEAWLANMNRNRDHLLPILKATYGSDQAVKWWVYWRIFFMSCAELWGFRGGTEWFVSHYLFTKRS